MFFFAAVRRSAQLDFTTPLTTCCNCGAKRGIAPVETPLRRTRYLLFGGTELTIAETFPYCAACRASAGRVRPGWLARGLCFVAMSAAIFTAVCIRLSINDGAFTPFVRSWPLLSSVLPAAAGCVAYFRWRDSRAGGRSYWQPVRLADVDLAGDTIHQATLAFFNHRYAQAFVAANAASMRAGLLAVLTD